MMAPMSRPSVSSFWALLVLLSLLGCSLPTGLGLFPTATPTHTPTASPTQTATPTPTPLPEAELAAGLAALFNGDWEGALAEFHVVLSQASEPELRAAALLHIGDTYLRSRRYAQAVESLSIYLATYPEGEDRAKAHFLRARAQEALGLPAEAIGDYENYLLLHPGRIDAFVHEAIGDALRRAGRPLEAVSRYELAIGLPRLEGPRALQIKIGRSFLEAGDFASAAARFEALAQTATDPVDGAAINLLWGTALEGLGDFDGAHERYLHSVMNYPQAYDAYSALVRLVNAGVPVDDFQRGLVDYYAGAYQPGLAALDRAYAATPTARALYYRALTRRALGDAAGARADLQLLLASYPLDPIAADAWFAKARTEWAYLDLHAEAVQTYLEFVAAFPASDRAPEALFAAARVAERAAELETAASIWLRLATEYPASSQAAHAAFQAGIARIRMGQHQAALQSFQLSHSLARDSGERARAWLWIGKALALAGDEAGSRRAWETARLADPTGYYSVRAADLLAGLPPFQAVGAYDFSADSESERAIAETWLRARFPIAGPEPLHALTPELASDARMVRGLEFWELGLYREAKAEFEALRRAHENDAEATYRLMHRFLELRMYPSAIFAARQILRLAGMDDAATVGAPTYFNRIRFGLYFADLIVPEASQHGLDGLFLLAVARQESLFEGFAVSYADARGLMQIIPSTGEWLSGQLGWPPNYRVEDLDRPLVSVRLGTYFLASQRDAFGGDLYAALAAYNAGPGNAAVWKRLAPSDPDLLLEVIRLDQPHLYIRRIYEIYAFYRMLYARPQ